MDSQIRVTPERLREAGGIYASRADRLLGLHGRLHAVASAADGALGNGVARVCFADMWTGWSPRLAALAIAVAAQGQALTAAAAAYTATDVTAIPPGTGRGPGTVAAADPSLRDRRGRP